MEWQPIATCPLKTYVLLWLDGFAAVGYQFKRGCFSENSLRARHEMFHATHWCAIPAPPQEDREP